MEIEIKEKVTADQARRAMAEINAMVSELSDAVLTLGGKSYDLKEWVTVTEYAKRNQVTLARINNWISRGVVPADCWIVVPELNYLKLLKDRPYSPRAYEASAK